MHIAPGAGYAPLLPLRDVSIYYRIDPKSEEPERLLDPENQYTEPWSGTVRGRCDKCDGSGKVEHECESCKANGADPSCEHCSGSVSYWDECPVCHGSGEIDDSQRDGVSVFPDLDGLYRYMLRREADLGDDCRVIELRGEQSEDRDFDADEGAVLVNPTEILDVGELDWDRIERVRRELD
jgi:hypothetical protein